MNVIADLHSEGTTIIQVTHVPSLAVSTGHRTLALQNGRLVYDRQGKDRELPDLQRAWSSQDDVSMRAEITENVGGHGDLL